ncbi:MAG TPA: NADH-quinone oxidoreductase subunit N, partial [Nocardioides sp.]|nr:NADH-quinone oxidoreductase subunit N [Nocardioides sp.]
MTALATDSSFVMPHIAYGSLWPILVIFGAACVGVLVEAFLPRHWRYLAQFGLTLGAMVVALVGVGFVANGLPERGGGAARGLFGSEGTVALDGPTMFMWGLVLVFGLGGVLLFAERHVEGGVSAFAGQAAALPGTESERRTQALDHTEVYPLLLFAV